MTWAQQMRGCVVHWSARTMRQVRMRSCSNIAHMQGSPAASAYGNMCGLLQTSNSVESIYRTAAFSDVIFRGKQRVQQALPACPEAGVGLVVVRFSITCDIRIFYMRACLLV